MLEQYCVIATPDLRVELTLPKNRLIVDSMQRKVERKFRAKKNFRLTLVKNLKSIRMTVSPKWRQNYGLGGKAYFGKTEYNGITYDVEISFSENRKEWNYITLKNPAL